MILPHNRAGMNMAQRPVIHSPVHQIVHRTGRIGVVVRVASHVGMQNRNRKTRVLVSLELQCQIVKHIPLGKTRSINVRQRLTLLHHRHGVHIGTGKDRHSFRPL